MAEGEGFEPPLPVKVKRFSRPPVSTTHTSLRGGGAPTALNHTMNAAAYARAGRFTMVVGGIALFLMRPPPR